VSKSTLNSENDKLKFLQIVGADVLSAACRGEIDLNLMAREELAKRGLDEDGRWVGFEKSLLSLIEYKSARPLNRQETTKKKTGGAE
jgi:hypothetical protein